MADLEEALQGASNPQAHFVFLLCFTAALLALLHLATTARRRASSGHGRLPPSPPGLPAIGHLHHLMASSKQPYVAMRDLAEKHGADGLLLLRLGQVPTVVASSPRAAEAILHTQDHVFASRPRSAIADIVLGGPTDVGFTPYGDYWRKARRLITENLLSAGKVQSFRRAREEEVRLVVAKVRAAAGTIVDMSEVLNSFELDLVCRAVSGKFFHEGGRYELFRRLIDENAAVLGGFNVADCFPGIAKVPLLMRAVCRRATKLREGWDELLDELIDDHASKPPLEEEERDFIDAVLSCREEYGLTRVNIRAITLDMFSGGSDTSYIILEFGMTELIRQPHLLAKLQAEVRTKTPKGREIVTEDDVASMSFLKAIIKETLRLHPPAPLLVPHFSMAECNVLGEYTIPSGTRVMVNAWALGRDRSSWERPDEFLPDRFMDDGETTTIDYKGRNFQFLPFGAGRRICPGMNFGLATIEIMLANLMYCFDWELPPSMKEEDIKMTDKFGVMVRRKEKLLLVPRPHTA